MRAIRVAASLSALMLFACSAQSPPPAQSQLHFDGPPIRLDVARVEVVTEYTMPLAPPNVEHLMPVPLPVAAKRWAEERLQPTGSARVARIIIQDGSVVQTPLKKTEGVKGYFTNDQEARYDARLVISLAIMDDRAAGLGTAAAEATRSRTIAEKATLNDRDKLYYEITDQLVRDVDQALQKQMATNLARYVLN